jgi:protein tyrosine/serine phosphatase
MAEALNGARYFAQIIWPHWTQTIYNNCKVWAYVALLISGVFKKARLNRMHGQRFKGTALASNPPHLTGRPLTAADALDAMQTTYRDFVKVDSHRFAELFDHLLEKSDPLLFHCTAGKDRTGLAAALVLSALGVSEADIWKDYLLTNQLYKRNSTGATTLSPDVLKIVWEVQESFLKASLDEIHAQHGSLQNYLTGKLRLSPAALAKLHALYLV